MGNGVLPSSGQGPVPRAAPTSFRAAELPDLDSWKAGAAKPEEELAHRAPIISADRIQVKIFQTAQVPGRDSRPGKHLGGIQKPWARLTLALSLHPFLSPFASLGFRPSRSMKKALALLTSKALSQSAI